VLQVPEAFAVDFPDRRSAKAARVGSMDELPRALDALGLTSRPTLVLVGGADGLTAGDLGQLHGLFSGTVAPLVEELGAQIVDGATDAGVMRLIGRVRGELRLSFPLIGVAAVGNVAVPGVTLGRDGVELEPNHSHFLLVAGEGWGREAPWIARLASMLADGEASATLLVNGGEISWADLAESVTEGRPVVAVAGSGGTADAVVAHLDGTRPDARAELLEPSGLLIAADRPTTATSVRTILERLLGAGR
jgi:hypothetical protein